MLSFLKGRTYRSLNKISIHQEALKFNHRQLQNFHSEALVCPVLKSNAYGHGLELVGPVFDELRPPFLVVDSLFEAYELYKLSLKTPILIMGYTHPDNFKHKRLPFHAAVFDLELAHVLNKYQPGCSVHLFVDTGMTREGIQLEDLPDFLNQLKELKRLNVVGICSHLADADNPKSIDFVKTQIANYQEALQIMNQEGFNPLWRHISASGGSFKIKDSTFNLIRAGLASYGINPLEPTDPAYDQLNLQPALSFTSILAQVKCVSKGTKVGYNGTFSVKHDMILGLIPAGYYEGIDRRLSNKGTIQVKGINCPIVGRVSMNMTTIDLSAVDNPQVGDKVVIYSSRHEDSNSLVNVARTAETIPYELLVHLAESVRREIK